MRKTIAALSLLAQVFFSNVLHANSQLKCSLLERNYGTPRSLVTVITNGEPPFSGSFEVQSIYLNSDTVQMSGGLDDWRRESILFSTCKTSSKDERFDLISAYCFLNNDVDIRNDGTFRESQNLTGFRFTYRGPEAVEGIGEGWTLASYSARIEFSDGKMLGVSSAGGSEGSYFCTQ